MPRLTITLSEENHRALKEAAVRQGRSIASVIEESLEFRGIRTMAGARDLVRAARAGAVLSEDEALSLAVEETLIERSS